MVRYKLFIGILMTISILVIILNFKLIENSYKVVFYPLENKGELFCIVLTSEINFKNRAVSVWNSWGKKCDKTVFVCNCSSIKNEENLPILQLNITEDVNKMAGKVLLSLKLVYDKYGSTYKSFLLTDDDTFIFVDNARKFISTKNEHEPFTYGYNFKITLKNGFHSGGAGILFTHESIKRLTYSISKGACNITKGFGDIAIGICSEQSNVTMGNSLDHLGRERFHPLSLKSHFMEPVQGWLIGYSSNKPKAGAECCSDETISFHYIKPEEMIKISENLKNETKIHDFYLKNKHLF